MWLLCPPSLFPRINLNQRKAEDQLALGKFSYSPFQHLSWFLPCGPRAGPFPCSVVMSLVLELGWKEVLVIVSTFFTHWKVPHPPLKVLITTIMPSLDNDASSPISIKSLMPTWSSDRLKRAIIRAHPDIIFRFHLSVCMYLLG